MKFFVSGSLFCNDNDLILTDSDGIELKTKTALARLEEEICNNELSSLRLSAIINTNLRFYTLGIKL
ncbi:hypothetical protein BpHYR1_004051 [Brachionus plicatilis]|uniref:Uncharacterized protein n=1 Tax=Brachionus plicatilis TaxID=10195 RepID=A0A3M7RRZ9_BRAPC|nr:hypothetical protein BpHYR1_004051 [Brachionus plicatilis]